MDGAGAAEGGVRAASRQTVRVRFRKEALSLRQVQSPKETVGPGGNMAGRQRPRVTPGPRCGSRGPRGGESWAAHAESEGDSSKP